MRNLYSPFDAEAIKERIARLMPDSQPQWGKMNVAQAMAHCARSMEWAVGDRIPPKMLLPSLLGRAIKGKVFGDDAPFRRNTPTATDLIVADQRELDFERARLIVLIDRFVAGPAACTTHPHSFFGKLKPEEWAILTYKHLDHHLRQFGV